jgi:hypothetical protein
MPTLKGKNNKPREIDFKRRQCLGLRFNYCVRVIVDRFFQPLFSWLLFCVVECVVALSLELGLYYWEPVG